MKQRKTWLYFLQRSIDEIMASNLNPVGVFSFLESNRKFYHIYTVTVVMLARFTDQTRILKNSQKGVVLRQSSP